MTPRSRAVAVSCPARALCRCTTTWRRYRTTSTSASRPRFRPTMCTRGWSGPRSASNASANIWPATTPQRLFPGPDGSGGPFERDHRDNPLRASLIFGEDRHRRLLFGEQAIPLLAFHRCGPGLIRLGPDLDGDHGVLA